MSRLLASSLVCALALTSAALMSPSTASAADDPVPAPTTVTVAGGGRGESGPASRAQISSYANVDVASDGTVLVSDGNQVMRVDPVSDRMQVIVPRETIQALWMPGPVVADGISALFLSARGIDRIEPDGTLTAVTGTPHITAMDVGSDRVIWYVYNHRVYRLTPGVSWGEVPTSGQLVDPIAITVTPDGSKAFVLDRGEGHAGIYALSPSGLGARVAGNGTTSGPFEAGVASGSISVAAATSLTTNGATVTVASMDAGTLSFPAAGGQLSQVATGACSYAVAAMAGGDTAVYCHGGSQPGSVHRFSSAGVDRGRMIGADPDQPWSPDGVRADDAYLDTVRGAAQLPDGRVVFSTENGLVREVTAQGTLRTRTRLAALPEGRGKVAVAPDGTAYVTTPGGTVTKVTESGAVSVVGVDADAADIEVLANGSLAVADAAAHRILVVSTGGATSVLTSALGTPVDLARDGDDLLVADDGLRRVDTATGDVTRVLSGGNPTTVTVTADGPWADPDYGFARVQVIAPDGALRPVKELGGPVAQLQAGGDGTVLRGGGQEVSRILTPGLAPTVQPVELTATPGEGRINLAWDPDVIDLSDLVVVAKRGGVAPRDLWDGQRVPVTGRGGQAVMLVGGQPLVTGEQWSFALFNSSYFGYQSGSRAWSRAAGASAASLADTTPPAQVQPVLTPTQLEITLRFSDPRDDDFDHVVVRYALGTTPPATPTDGIDLPSDFPWASSWLGGSIPHPVRDQDYAISVFAFDHQGNASVWSKVTRLDFEPPAPATNLEVVPDYRTATFTFTPPADEDYDNFLYAVVPPGVVPDVTKGNWSSGSSGLVQGLVMDTDYVLAVWTQDKMWNHAAPVTVPFRTKLDTVAPGSPGSFRVTGGDYAVTATWTAPDDLDLRTYVGRLTDVQTGGVTEVTLQAPVSSFSWTKLPGGRDYSVELIAVDQNGLRSVPSTDSTRTADDTNGSPAPLALADVKVTPASSTSVTVSLPRPAIPDLKSIQYDVRPLGSSPDPVGTLKTLSIKFPTVTGTVTLPSRGTAYTLVLYVEDFNGNRSRTIVPSVEGAPNASELPLAAPNVFVSTPQDNTIDVTWGFDTRSVPVSSWQLTATSGTLSKTMTVDGSSRAARVSGLAGRSTWTLSIAGVGTLGTGAKTVMTSIAVGDTTAPKAVTSAARVSSFDTDVVSWVNPTDFDLDRVEVTRYGQTAAETKLVYRGKGTSFTSTGLVGGRTYSYQIRTYDSFGQTLATAVRLDTTRALLTVTSPTSLRYGSAASVTGTLRWKTQVPSSRSLKLYAQAVGKTTWTAVASASATSTGAYSFTVKPSATTRYRVGYAGAGTAGGTYSAVRTLTVAPTLTMVASRSTLPLGSSVLLSSTVRPAHPGASVQLQRWNGKAWATITTRTLSSASTVKVYVRPSSRGTQSYRWVLPAHADHATGVSAKVSVKVS